MNQTDPWNSRPPILVAGAVALLVGLALPLDLLAQREVAPRVRPTDRLGPAASELRAFTPLVIRGSGGSDERPIDDTPPRDLTLEQKSEMIASLGLRLWGGQGPWKLTPASPVVPGRASLGFREAEYVWVGSESGAGARIHGRQTYGPAGNVSLGVHATAASERYLIDCKVSPSSRGLRFSGPGGSATFTNTEHLIAIYEATDTAEAYFRIDTPLENGSTSSWTFYSCEITPLQGQ